MTELAKVVNDYILRERSDYQLKNFVVGQHATPQMQYRQILLEAKDLLFKIKNAEIEIEITKKKIEKLESSSDEIDHLKAKQRRLGLAMTLTVLEGAKRELDYLVKLSENYKHYTPKEIEENQEEYWQKRLGIQANIDRISIEQGISKENIESLMKAGLIQEELETSSENLTTE